MGRGFVSPNGDETAGMSVSTDACLLGAVNEGHSILGHPPKPPRVGFALSDEHPLLRHLKLKRILSRCRTYLPPVQSGISA
jgi:hypothetical protein